MSLVSGLISAAGAIADSVMGSSAASKIVSAANSAFINADGTSISAMTNARAYLNSGDLLGRVEKVEFSMPKARTNEYKAIGMISTINLPGGLEQPELKVSWNGFYGDLSQYIDNHKAVLRFQLIGSNESYNNRGLSKVSRTEIQVHGMVKEHSTISVESGTPAKFETTLNVTYLKEVIDGVETCEFDVFNNIYKVRGVSIFDV